MSNIEENNMMVTFEMPINGFKKEEKCQHCMLKDAHIQYLEGKVEGILEMHKSVVESLQNEIKRLKDDR